MRSDMLILLVEDDEVDSLTVKRALEDLKVTNPIVTIPNGEEALAFLRADNKKRPVIVLLDLNMPKMGGIEFLRMTKQDDALKGIPVVVLTTSTSELDKIDSFALGVAGYMIKPVDYEQFLDMVRTIDLYWTASELP